MSLRHKALFLDRDGVINQEVGYLHAADEVRWVEGVFELCQVAAGLGYKLVVVTNQSGIARGLYTEGQFEELTAWMLEEFVKQGVALDAVYFCPFHPEGVGKYKGEHELGNECVGDGGRPMHGCGGGKRSRIAAGVPADGYRDGLQGRVQDGGDATRSTGVAGGGGGGERGRGGACGC